MSCTSTVESITVRRHTYMIGDGCPKHRRLLALVNLHISWTMPDGISLGQKRTFDGFELLDLPLGTVPMMTPIYCLPHEGHPGACTQGIAYVIRIEDENGKPDIAARFMRKLDPHAPPDDIFSMPGGLADVGQFIYPLIIEDQSLEH